MDTVTIDGDVWNVVDQTDGGIIVAVRGGMTAITTHRLLGGEKDDWVAVGGDTAKDELIEALVAAKDYEL